MWRALLCATAAASGCAYAFTYGGGSPRDATVDVQVEPLTDLTGDGWPAAVATSRLRERLGPPRHGRDGMVLHGELTGVDAESLPTIRPNAPPGQAAAAVATLRVRGRARLLSGQGTLVRDLGEREGRAEMLLGDSVSQSEDLRRLALERAAEAFADDVAEAVLHP